MNIPYASKRILIFYNFIPFINILFFLIFFQNDIRISFLCQNDLEVNWTSIIFINQSNSIVSLKNIIHWSQLNSSYMFLTPINCSESFSYVSNFIREYATYVHLKNVFCTSRRAIATKNAQIRLYPQSPQLKSQLPTAGILESVVFIYSEFAIGFGHCFTDAFPALVCIPQEIIEKSKIMICLEPKYSQPYLDVLGIPKSKIIYDMKSWYFANNLYLYYAKEARSSLNVYSFPKLVDVLRNKLGVENITGTRYVFTNKPKGVHRHIHNINQFIDLIKLEHPQFPWEYADFSPSNLTRLSHEIASYKLWCAPSGSMMHNIVYMNRNKKCGVCLISSRRIDYANYGVASQMNLWLNAISSTARIDDKRGFSVDLYYGSTCIRRLLYAMKNGKWPDDTFQDMKGLVDYPYVKKLLEQNVESRIWVSIAPNHSYLYHFEPDKIVY